MDAIWKAKATEALQRYRDVRDARDAARKEHENNVEELELRFRTFRKKTLPSVTGDVASLLHTFGLRHELRDEETSVTVRIGPPGPLGVAHQVTALGFHIDQEVPIVQVTCANSLGESREMRTLTGEQLADTAEIEALYVTVLEMMAEAAEVERKTV